MDRKKDMLVYEGHKGYLVYQRDREDVLDGLPAVARPAVVGKTEGRYGEPPVAFALQSPTNRRDWA